MKMKMMRRRRKKKKTTTTTKETMTKILGVSEIPGP